MKSIIIIVIAFVLFIPTVAMGEIKIDETNERLFYSGASSLSSADIDGHEFSSGESIKFNSGFGFDINEATQKIYLFEQSTKNIQIIDPTTLQVIDEIEDDWEANPGSEIRQRDILVNDNTNKIYLLLESYVNISYRPQDDQKYKIHVYDGSTNEVIAKFDLFSLAKELLYDESRNLIYAIGFRQGYWIIDDDENLEYVSLPSSYLGLWIFGVVLDEINNQLFLQMGDRQGIVKSILVVEANTGKEIQNITDSLILNGYPPVISQKQQLIFFRTISGSDTGLVIMDVEQRKNQILGVKNIPESDLQYLEFVDDTNNKLYGQTNIGTNSQKIVIFDIDFILDSYQSELEPEELEIPAPFVDETKDPQSYLDRYYNESEYKKWFDKNYPNLTIEEAIGLVEPFSLIKEQFNECEIYAKAKFNQELKNYMATTSSGIGAEINLANSGITLDNYLMICDEQNLVPLNDLAVNLLERGEPDSALYYLNNALELFPSYQVALVNKGIALFELEEYQEAKISFEKALETDPSLELAQQGIEETSRILQGEVISQSVCGTGTIDVNGQCVVDPNYKSSGKSSKGGGCLIATATYGSELAPQVQQLRELRDNFLLQTESGTAFMNSFNDFYYSFSPIIADYERENPIFKEMVKIAITPMITSLSILNYVDMDSEESVLGYGISLIMLNVMMYVGIPASIIVGIRRI